MPWKVSNPVSERLRFIQRLNEGERVVDLCEEFGISRKTAYKLKARFEEFGPAGLYDRSRAPKRIPHRTQPQIERLIVEARAKHPNWGPLTLRETLSRKHPGVQLPSTTTIDLILHRHGLVKPRKRRRHATPAHSPLRVAERPNHIWCADFKGEFRLGTGQYCYPLTITDRFSRYILRCEGLEGTSGAPVTQVFLDAFRDFGLPEVIRTDNGPPFASTGLFGLSKLSVLWLRLGIVPERIEPAHPQQNGQHERMHLVLKQETTRPAGANILQQQERFDRFVEEYNAERPHQGIDQRRPAELYVYSPRPCPAAIPEPSYPMHDTSYCVGDNGCVVLNRRHRFSLTVALAGQRIGMREVADGLWLVSFLDLQLGHYDFATKTFKASDELVTEEQAA
jgi:transposase InsO family protein